jgi:hypothetical protein
VLPKSVNADFGWELVEFLVLRPLQDAGDGSVIAHSTCCSVILFEMRRVAHGILLALLTSGCESTTGPDPEVHAVWDHLWAFVFGHDTQYAPAYTDAGFNAIRVGTPDSEVEGRWNKWNVIRTAVAILVALVLMMGLLRV